MDAEYVVTRSETSVVFSHSYPTLSNCQRLGRKPTANS
jgi:hypothetical protein